MFVLIDKTDESAGEDEPLTISVPERPSTSASGSSDQNSHTADDLSPKSPAERVRFILTDEKQTDKGTDAEPAIEDINLAHALFCQMDVLCHFEDDDHGWKECARYCFFLLHISSYPSKKGTVV